MNAIPTSPRLPALLFALAVAGCATSPRAPRPAAADAATPEQIVATIRAAAGSDGDELSVQPLRDPAVEDLRVDAQRLEAAGDYAAAAGALDKALALVPEDPALLQERAEAAVLLRDYESAQRLARRAYDLGARVGPLCRRHWATIRQVRLAQGDAAGAASAQAQAATCKVAGPTRY